MSEFQCVNRHELSVGQLICPICGLGVGYMDGLSNAEMRDMEGIGDQGPYPPQEGEEG